MAAETRSLKLQIQIIKNIWVSLLSSYKKPSLLNKAALFNSYNCIQLKSNQFQTELCIKASKAFSHFKGSNFKHYEMGKMPFRIACLDHINICLLLRIYLRIVNVFYIYAFQSVSTTMMLAQRYMLWRERFC